MITTDIASPNVTPPGVRDALRVLVAPSSVFRRIEDTGAYGRTLACLLVVVTLLGYVEVHTGLIERVEQRKTENLKDKLEREQRDLLSRVELHNQLEKLDKAGEFAALINKIKVAALAPAYFLTSILLIAACLYAMVALTGRKPEYHTLVGICVYAEFSELVAVVLRLLMVLVYRTIEVDTSLAMLATSKAWLWLSAIDPFRIWFWVLVAIGVTTTRQLSRRMAIVACVSMGLVAMAVRGLAEYLPWILS